MSRRGRIRVAVLMGGPSAEREVSLRSGAAVLAALDRRRYAPLGVDIRRDGTWGLPGDCDPEPSLLEPPAPGRTPTGSPTIPGGPIAAPGFGGLAEAEVRDLLARAAEERSIDVVFLALHGKFGEDGVVQGLLDAAGIPYTGSGVLASALAMDKEKARIVAAAAGLRVARGACVRREAWEADGAALLADLAREPGFPAFVKPVDGGSSLGAGPAEDAASLGARLDEVFRRHGDRALVEERLVGREVTCAVLGNRGRLARPLPPVEIVPRGRPFFDFEAKYDAAACDEICPAPVGAAERTRIEEAAVAAHEALGCDGMSRSDFVLVDGEPCYLETNTIPGMTDASLCPKAARAAGIPFPRLLDLLVGMALERGAASASRDEAA